MSFLDLANKRYSVRNYKDTPVPRSEISKCIEAVRLAPSACNSQPWKFVIVDDVKLVKDVANAAFEGILNFNNFVYKAPVLVLIIAERQTLSAKFGSIVKNKNFSLMDIGIAAEHFCLQAAEEGLGTCMLGWFNEKKVKKLLSIPVFKRVELIISVGFAADDKIPIKKRKSIDEILSFNKY
ncbi:MAG: nitroreductase family protein [Phycisphaerales bacterium]